ncbi:MAG: FtsK/SpoIIIE domain-containing protein [Bacillota bacterium]|nr:FtsK/SpoIIIE domain-containing protein [Bacillota bacterium]
MIEKEGKYIVCENGMSLTFAGFRFLYHDMKEQWYIYRLKDIQSIGRNKNNDLSISSIHISNNHARIEKKEKLYWIKDLGSRNGIYKNGNRIEQDCMENQDVFLLADCVLYRIHDILIVNHQCRNSISEVKGMIQNDTMLPIISGYVPSFEFQTIELEAPVIQEYPKKTKLFQAIGPSLLILMSSGLASGLEQALNSKSSYNPFQLLTPLCMSFAFLFYGLYNRQSHFKDGLLSYQKQEDLYEKHLRKKEKEALSLLHNYQTYLQEEQIFFLNLHETKFDSFRILIGQHYQNVPIYKFIKQGYQYEENHLVKKQKALIDKFDNPILVHDFYQKNEKVWIPMYVSSAFLYSFVIQAHHCTNPPKILIAHREIQENARIFGSPLCQYKGMDLYMSEDNVEAMLPFLENKLEYVLLTDSFSIIERLKPSSFIYMNPYRVSYPFDYVLEQTLEMDNTERKMRQLLWNLENSGKNPLSYFQKDEEEKVNLECCVGLDSHNREIYLNFEEGIDGPHALVAGMTGSGKSEFLSTMLLGLLVKNKPELLQYILVDFKGGAFGHAFYEFSHCAGMVTNLEKENLSRLMLSLKCEIEKRQIYLKNAKERHPQMISHIQGYNEIMETKMSHLFIIVDEFAQMKTKYPEYLENLKEYARIGRSLGIHLILATQKPMGIVDEQIWSNSTLKVCLKVNSEMDSKEMLHNEMGAYLKNAGEFIAQNLDGQRQGKSFYLQEPYRDITYFKECDKEDCDRTNKTLFTEISSWIEKGKQNWILLPDLSKKVEYENDQWAWMDIPEQQVQVPLFLKSGQSLLVLCQDDSIEREFINSLFHIFKKNIFTLGLDLYGRFPPIQEEREIEESTTWIIKEESFEWTYKYFKNPKLRIVIFVQSCGIKVHNALCYFDYRLCLQYKEVDTVRTFFDQFKLGTLPLVKTQDECHTIVYPTFRNSFPIQMDSSTKNVFLGIDVGKRVPVYYKHTLPLIICFVQKSKQKEIEDLLTDISKVFPHLVFGQDVMVVDVLKDPNFFSRVEYQEIQYDVNILWIGQGIQEYGYLLKRSIPYEREMDRIFYEGKEIKKIMYAVN